MVADAGPAAAASETPPPPPADVAAVAPLPVVRVTIDIMGLPAGARVVFDDAEVVRVPFRVEKSTQPVVLEIEAPGYRPYRSRVTPDRDLSLTPALRRAASGTRPPATVPGPDGQQVEAQTTKTTQRGNTTVQGARGTEILTSFE